MKRIMALLLVMAMVFSFAGCKKSEEETAAAAVSVKPAASGSAKEADANLGEAIANTMRSLEENQNFTVKLSAQLSSASEPVAGLKSGFNADLIADLKIHFDPENEELTVYGDTSAAGTYQTVLIHDGWSVSNELFDEYYKQDISDELDEFFEDMKQAQQAQEEAGERSLADIFDEIPEEVLEGLEQTFDSNMMLDLLLTLIEEKFQDEEWLKETFGYSVVEDGDSTFHTFEIDLTKIVNTLLDYFKDAFHDEDDYEDAKDSLEEAEEDLKDFKLTLKLIQTGDMLSGIAIDFSGKDPTSDSDVTIGASLTITDIGTTDIDFDALDEILENVEEFDDSIYEDYYEDYYDDFDAKVSPL